MRLELIKQGVVKDSFKENQTTEEKCESSD
jgi:hypothetical protein